MSKPEELPSGPVRPSDYLRVQEDDREVPGEQQRSGEGTEGNRIGQELDIEDREQQEALVGR